MMMLIWSLLSFLICLVGWSDSSHLHDYETCCNLSSSSSDHHNFLKCAQKELLTEKKRNDVLFVTFISIEILPYASLFMFYNRSYFEFHQYNLLILDEQSGEDYFPADRRWNKIQALHHGLTSWGKNYKYLIYIDADVIFSNPSIDIVDYVTAVYQENPSTHVIMSEDLLDFGNSGVMIVENHPWSSKFLARWIELKDSPNTYCDQHVLNRLSLELERNHSLQHIQLLPFPKINSEFPAIQTLSTNSTPLLIHFLGEYSEVREAIGRNLTDRLCKRLRSFKKVHHSSASTEPTLVDVLPRFPVPTRQSLVQLKFRALRERLNRFLMDYENAFASPEINKAAEFLDSLKHFCEFQLAMTPETFVLPVKRIIAPWDSHSLENNCQDYLQRFHEVLGNSLHYHYIELTKQPQQYRKRKGYELFFQKMRTLLSFYDVRISLVVLNTTLSTSSSFVNPEKLVDDEAAFLGDTITQLISLSENLQEGLIRGEDGEKERVQLFLRLFVLEKRVVLAIPLLTQLSRHIESRPSSDQSSNSIRQMMEGAKGREQVILSDLTSLIQLIQRNLIDNSAEMASYSQLLLQEQIVHYIESSTRLSFYYSLDKAWAESIEWCDIARNNVQLLRESFRGEDRIIVNLSREVSFQCAQVYEEASMNEDSENSDRYRMNAMQLVEEAESFRYHAGRLGHVQRNK